MKTNLQNPMADLRLRLSAEGIDNEYLDRIVLPDWWDDAAADDPLGLQEAKLYVANHLGLAMESLSHSHATPLEFQSLDGKLAVPGASTHDVDRLATAIAYQAATVAGRACRVPFMLLPDSIEALRRSMLSPDIRGMHLESLLDFCWKNGVPVIRPSEYPQHCIGCPTLLVMTEDRPIIVLPKFLHQSSSFAYEIAQQLARIVGISLHSVGEGYPHDTELISRMMTRNLDEERIPVEAHEWLLRLTGTASTIPV